jgi:integrase
MSEELYESLAELKVQRDWHNPHREHVFVRDSKPIQRFDKAWRSTCKNVGLEGLLFHDLRRSAVRNIVRSGVPERVAMAIRGHKTRSVFERYKIVSEGDLTKAAEALDKYHASMGTILGDVESAERVIDETQRC